MNSNTFQTPNLIPTTEFPCSYIDGQMKRVLLAAHGGAVSQSLYMLAADGFQRNGDFVTKAFCRNCQSCKPARIEIKAFNANRTQRKIVTKNRDLHVSIWDTQPTVEQYELYQRYHQVRHPDGEMALDGLAEFGRFISSFAGADIAEFRAADGTLVMASLFEQGDDAVFAHHSWYALEMPSHSLGIFNILWLANLARRTKRQHLYLGDWLAGNRKLAYKTAFQGAEILKDNKWMPYQSL